MEEELHLQVVDQEIVLLYLQHRVKMVETELQLAVVAVVELAQQEL